MGHRLTLILALLLAPAAADSDDAQALRARARELGLAGDPTWQALLHVAPGFVGLGHVSEVPEGRFFVSPDGARDAAAELDATLAGLLAAPASGDEALHCRFPARTAWLAERLHLPRERLVTAPCPSFDAWHAQLRPLGITLILPEAYMNNPASLFGHTLLRLDVADPASPENLLGYAIDFTVDTQGEGGPIPLLKGTFGGYPGLFGLNPYYEKLELYASWQNRDVWEYPLDLSESEIEFLLFHLWELGDVPIPYRFFRENCSYQLIRLLAVVRPGLRFSHGFPYGVIPVDTVRDVLDQIGLSGEVRYRPSPATELRAVLSALPPEQRRLTLALARGELAPDAATVAALDDEARGVVVGTAWEALRYSFLKEEEVGEQTQKRAHRLLVARSQAAPGGAPGVARPAVRPDEGHGTALVSLGGGVEDDDAFVELRLRPALHARLDPSGGFPEDSTLRFLDTTLRYFPETDRLRLDELVLVDLQSRSARDDFFRPLSWGMATGAYTRLFPEDHGAPHRRLVWRTSGSVGLTWAPGNGRFALYGLANARLEVGSGFDGGWALGPGLELGTELNTAGERLATRLFARGTRFLGGHRENDVHVGLAQRVTLTRTTAAVAEGSYQHFDHAGGWEARLSLQWTF